MLARYAGSTLGLFAFAVAIIAGLSAHNPVTTTLSRSLFALFAFFLIGYVLGSAAQLVVNEHRMRSNEDIERKYQTARNAAAGANGNPGALGAEGGALKT